MLKESLKTEHLAFSVFGLAKNHSSSTPKVAQ
jgi:hypothetical protein